MQIMSVETARVRGTSYTPGAALQTWNMKHLGLNYDNKTREQNIYIKNMKE